MHCLRDIIDNNQRRPLSWLCTDRNLHPWKTLNIKTTFLSSVVFHNNTFTSTFLKQHLIYQYSRGPLSSKYLVQKRTFWGWLVASLRNVEHRKEGAPQRVHYLDRSWFFLVDQFKRRKALNIKQWQLIKINNYQKEEIECWTRSWGQPLSVRLIGRRGNCWRIFWGAPPQQCCF